MFVYRNGLACVSKWALSDAEVDEIIRTRSVFISVLNGQTQPPVYAGSEETTRELLADYGVWAK